MQVIEGLDGTDCFIDDVLVWGCTKEEHDLRLHQVFDRFRSKGVKLQLSKCHFRLEEVTYYGHVLSGKGVRLSEAKLQAVTEIKRPKSKKDVRRFLGLVAYVVKFLDRQSQVAAPLRELLQDDVAWMWSLVQQQAFLKLKALVTEVPVVAFYSPRAQNNCVRGCFLVWHWSGSAASAGRQP